VTVSANPGAGADLSVPASSQARGTGTGALKTLYVVVFAATVLLVFIPIAALIYGSFRTAAPGDPHGAWTLKNYAGLMSEGVLSTLLLTLWIGVLTAIISVIFGVAIALVVHRTDFKYPNTVTALIGLAFYFPSFILAMAWIIIGSPGGVINYVWNTVLGLPGKMDIYTTWGIVLVMVLHQVPFVYLTMRGPITAMDGIYEEAARTSGATPAQVLSRITLPLLGYSVASSFILTFITSIEQFAIPALIGSPGRIHVLATQLYLLCRFPPTDYGLAATIGLTLSAITGLAIWLQRRIVGSARLTTVGGKAGRLTPIRLGPWKWAAYLLTFGFAFLALILPALILVYTSLIKFFNANPLMAAYTTRNYEFIWNSAATLSSFRNTIVACGLAAAMGSALGFLVSYFTLRQRPQGSRFLDMTASLPFGVPGVVIGLGLLWAYAYLPLPLYGTLAIIIIAYVTRYLPYATETIGGQMVQVDKSLEEAAWVSGASRIETLSKILLPIVLPSVQSSFFLLFMAFFREISSAILLFTASTMVISVSIFAFFDQANWGLASALSVIATLIIFIVMWLILLLSPNARRKWS
jgi:iron(III) transport system permease protein